MDYSSFSEYFTNKTVLVTGHTGFKGSWLCIWLLELGANVVGFALDPRTERDNYVISHLEKKMIDIRGDIRDKAKVDSVFKKYRPEIVFHLAAQPLVRYSYQFPKETYEINVMGTINILENVRISDRCNIGVFITTDKCYENREQEKGYKESDPMGGYDPYSSSKGACELAISSWRNSFFNAVDFNQHLKAIVSVRAGNVVGGGDWAEGRLIPDCVKAIEKDGLIEIRYPNSTRPWLFVLEPLAGYLLLAERLGNDPVGYSGAWNFGPEPNSAITVLALAKMVVEYFGKGSIKDISEGNHPHEARLLSLDISKAERELGWMPSLSIEDRIRFTIEWYKNYSSRDMYEFCRQQIAKFIEI